MNLIMVYDESLNFEMFWLCLVEIFGGIVIKKIKFSIKKKKKK